MKPCKRGHTSGRNKHGNCIECKHMSDAAWNAANPEKAREAIRKWRAANPEKVRVASNARVAKWRITNPEKARALLTAANTKWGAANPEKLRAKCAKRRAAKLLQRCTCCTDAQIWLLYFAAKPWGPEAEIDHRVPLALGGKHCAKNLVLLPTPAHREKTKADVRAIAEAKRRSRLLLNWRAA
jgi:hypothetical protein